ncbi:unnamed protein product [Diabrotica balteata]|uniref:Uncharacterized protein n=1 Tax=Diabrotica balteata TaxID=107213 RepID=A0A9N9XI31_DIABA|nr:unnamed protein product [Diabrotica balteata]
MQSLKSGQKLYASVEEMQQLHEIRWIDVKYLKKAVDILCRCQQTLMYTDVFAYYLKRNNQSVIFKFNQQYLERETKLLSEYLKRAISQKDLLIDETQIQDSARFCDRLRITLVNHVYEGYEKDWWLFSE